MLPLCQIVILGLEEGTLIAQLTYKWTLRAIHQDTDFKLRNLAHAKFG